MNTSRVDTLAFNAMCRQGARMAAVPYERFVKNEVGKVLEAAAKFTPAVQVNRLRLRYENAQYSAQPRTLYTPKRPTGATLTKRGYVKYFLANRYPNTLWSAISARRKARLLKLLGARGLAKKSWWKIANALGIKISVPAYVGRAVASTGQEYDDVSANSSATDAQVVISISNAQPTVNKIGGANALARAIDGRVKFFLQNIKHLVFNDVAKIAKAYPGIRAYLAT